MAIPVHRTIVFFPTQPLEGSPYFGRSWVEILPILHACLQQTPDLVTGYTIGTGHGNWFDDNSRRWMADTCTVIEIYTSPGFAGKFRDPNNPTNSAAKYLASLSYLSSVQMGHSEFLAIVDNQRCRGDSRGLHIGRDGELVEYTTILPTRNWLQLPFAADPDPGNAS